MQYSVVKVTFQILEVPIVKGREGSATPTLSASGQSLKIAFFSQRKRNLIVLGSHFTQALYDPIHWGLEKYVNSGEQIRRVFDDNWRTIFVSSP